MSDDSAAVRAAVLAFPPTPVTPAKEMARLIEISAGRVEANAQSAAELALRVLDRAGSALRRGDCPRCLTDSCPGNCWAPASAASVLSAAELLTMELPTREPYLVAADGSPILRTKDSWMLAAERGLGKTWCLMALELALATGGQLWRWRAPRPVSVLRIDGEMPASALKERLRLLLGGAPPPERYRFLAADLQPDPLPSLATPAGQALVEPALAGVEVLVVDNISSTMSAAAENDADAWAPAQDWLLSLRRRGLTVILAHHAGRSGAPRGTSRREDVLDAVLMLRRPHDYRAEDGCRMEIAWAKARALSGRSAETFEARLEIADGRADWTLKNVAGAAFEAAVELLSEGASPRDVADALSISRATAFRYQSQARREGRIATPKKKK